MDRRHDDCSLSVLRPARAMIEIRDLEKRFGAQRVLCGVNLSAQEGRVTAILGPNGSGKTTLIKILLGLAQADGGRVLTGGREVTQEASQRERIGYMPQVARFPENLTAREVLAMLTDLRGQEHARDEELLDAFGLAREMDKRLRTLSGGNRQKVSAAIAFLFDPDLVILDEPTAGLDPVASSILKDKIHRERARGKTFILTSHIMSEVEELANDLAFLLDGRERFVGAVAEIKHTTGEARLERAIARMMTGAAA